MSFLYRGAMLAGSWWCHQLPERSPHLFGLPLPLCWRCAGIALGAAALLCWLVRTKRLPPLALSLWLAAALPLDVLLNALGGGGLDNPRRFLTGVLWGFFATSAALRLPGLFRGRRARARRTRPLPA
ncbi:MAG: DUF2085 domain-containing protein [Acidobacteria bacterium]|nr:DUF2085 domain-containing protein [Acidobacteriota bacterium]